MTHFNYILLFKAPFVPILMLNSRNIVIIAPFAGPVTPGAGALFPHGALHVGYLKMKMFSREYQTHELELEML